MSWLFQMASNVCWAAQIFANNSREERETEWMREIKRKKRSALWLNFWKAIFDGSIRAKEVAPLPSATTLLDVFLLYAITYSLSLCFASALPTGDGDLKLLWTLEEVGAPRQCTTPAAPHLASIRHVSQSIWRPVGRCQHAPRQNGMLTSAVCWCLCKKVATWEVK